MSETEFRLFFFFGFLFFLVFVEQLFPHSKQPKKTSSGWRWLNHFGLSIIGTALTRIILPAGLAGAALFFQNAELGLLQLLSLPYWFSLLLGIVILDFIIYWQHRLFHKIPILWRLHRVHHIDPDVSATTAIRFHPVEIILSLMIKLLIILTFGISPEAVIVFEIILSSLALFNHSNFRLPDKCEAIVNKFLITPSIHRIHHSIILPESQKNFGFSVPFWDRIFGSYAEQSAQPRDNYIMGVKGFDGKNESLISLLSQPFKK